MDSFGAVRKLARAKHEEMKNGANGQTNARALLDAARRLTGVVVEAMPPEHPLLSGGDGALYRNGGTASLYISSSLSPETASYTEAHEFGHLWIETPEDPAV